MPLFEGKIVELIVRVYSTSEKSIERRRKGVLLIEKKRAYARKERESYLSRGEESIREVLREEEYARGIERRREYA